MRSIFALLFGTACVLIANGLLGTVIGLRLTVQGHAVGLAGAVVAGFAVGMVVGSTKASWVIERVGHIRAYASFCGLATFATLVMLLVETPAAWLLIRASTGFCVAGGYLVVESWLSAQTPPRRRGMVFAAYITVCQLALAAGQLLVRVYPVTGFAPFVIAAALYSAALVPISMTAVAQPDKPSARRRRIAEVVRATPVGVAGAGAAGVVAGSALSLAPIFAAGIGLDRQATATFMAVVVVGGLTLQWPVGWLSDRVDRRLVIEGLALFATVLALALAVAVHSSFALLLAAGLGYGAFISVLYPVSLAHAQDFAGEGEAVSVSSAMVLVYGIGASAGPMLGALVMELAGVRALPFWLAGGTGLLALVGLARLAVRRRLTVDEPVAHLPLPLPQTAPTVEIDPRDEVR